MYTRTWNKEYTWDQDKLVNHLQTLLLTILGVPMAHKWGLLLVKATSKVSDRPISCYIFHFICFSSALCSQLSGVTTSLQSELPCS
jgi:p-aminobenzoyl-glutamate transporter AbgT